VKNKNIATKSTKHQFKSPYKPNIKKDVTKLKNLVFICQLTTKPRRDCID